MRPFEPLAAPPVRLRPLAVAEAPVVVAYRRDPRVARYQAWGVVDPGEIERDLTAMATRTPCDLPGPWFQLAITLADSDTVVGDIGVRLRQDELDTAEVGYTVAPAFHGRGFATAAVRALCGWLLGPRGLARVVATIDGRNAPSIAVVERSGFTRICCIETRHTGVRATLLTYERRA